VVYDQCLEYRDHATAPRPCGAGPVSTVDDVEWAAFRARLRDEYEQLLVAVTTLAQWDEDALGMAMGAIAHTAYHLGAIRQRLQAP
jgi:hypothetical protein